MVKILKSDIIRYKNISEFLLPTTNQKIGVSNKIWARVTSIRFVPGLILSAEELILDRHNSDDYRNTYIILTIMI